MAILDGVVREGLAEEVTFELRPCSLKLGVPVKSCSVLLETVILSGYTILHSHQEYVRNSVSLYTSQHLVFSLSYFSHPSRYVVISICGVAGVSLMVNNVEQLSMCKNAICDISKMSIPVLCPFSHWTELDF